MAGMITAVQETKIEIAESGLYEKPYEGYIGATKLSYAQLNTMV